MDNDFIASIKQSLKDIYEKYKDKGLKAIYLWGSVTTEDFDIKTSDIDSIGIVNDGVDVAMEYEIKHELEQRHPEVVKFGFRIAYEGELKGVIKPTSHLASVILPRLLLLDLPHWTFVVGKKYLLSDFTDNPPMPQEGLYWRLEQLKNKGWNVAEDVEEGKEQRFLKILWRIVYLFQLSRGLEGQFSYSSLIVNVNEEEKPFINAIQTVKKSGYNRERFLIFIPVFNNLLNLTRQKAIKP